MKKNVFQGFQNKKVNLLNVKGGYFYSPTQLAGTDEWNDEELVTEPSDNDSACSPNYSCQDEVWKNCTPDSLVTP